MKLQAVGTTVETLKGDTSWIAQIVMKDKIGSRCEGFETIQVMGFLGLVFSQLKVK